MLTNVDVIAAIVGAVCAIYSYIFGPHQNADGANALLGFFSGAAAAYLVIMAYALWQDVALLNRMIRTNPLPVFAAFVYVAYINIMALPGLRP